MSDDGIGFDPAQIRKDPGLGLNIMRYRARVIGAALEIYPNTPTGTVVTCALPQNQKAEGRGIPASHPEIAMQLARATNGPRKQAEPTPLEV